MTSIVIVTFNQLPYTKLCLESIRRNTPQPYELIVVDNASTDQTADFLSRQSDVKLIRNTENKGFPAAANQGMRQSTGSTILLLNNDTIVPAGWLGRLLRPLEADPQLGLVGPRSNNVSGPQQIKVTYSDPADLEHFAAEHAAADAGKLYEAQRLVGFCLLFRREVMDRVGLLDERFGMGNFEDDDFCRRALAAGFRAAIVGDAYVHHFGSVSFAGSKVDMHALLKKNQQLFLEKWSSKGVPPSDQSNPVSLSLCMIVRDSSKTIGPCLESIRPWVDEMIVVDTGSVDNTIDIVRSFGAKVYEFPWPDSFAIARNESLKHATGRWIFWMDSDDTIDAENGRKLRELITSDSGENTAYVMQVHCPGHDNGGGEAYGTPTVVDHVKLFRNDPAIRFTGRIHEQALPSIRKLGGKVGWTDIHVVHSGSDPSPEALTRKLRRDLRLLELELADEPDHTFTLFNLGMTLLYSNRAEEAVSMFCRSLQMAVHGESHIRKLYALLAAAYAQLGRPQSGLKTCVQGLAVCPGDPELTFRKGVLEQAVGKLADAERSFRTLVEMAPDRYFSSIDRGILGVKAWHNLANIHERQGQYASAAGAWRKVVTLDPGNLLAWRGLVHMLSLSKDYSGLESLSAGADTAPPAEIRLIARARLLCQRGSASVAARELEQAVQAGASIDVLDELCRVAFTGDLLDVAERWLTELTRRRPSDASAFLNLGMVQLRKSKYAQAAESARRSLELRPNYRPCLDLLVKATDAANGRKSASGLAQSQAKPRDKSPGN